MKGLYKKLFALCKEKKSDFEDGIFFFFDNSTLETNPAMFLVNKCIKLTAWLIQINGAEISH